MRLLDISIHLLLIEDDEVDIQNIKRAFKKNNVFNPLHIARNGLEALDMLQGKNGKNILEPVPKIILLDINMPKMNGIEFLKALRADPKLSSILVFILTSSDEHREKLTAYNLNVAGYILKPVQFTELITVIDSLNLYWSLLEFPS